MQLFAASLVVASSFVSRRCVALPRCIVGLLCLLGWHLAADKLVSRRDRRIFPSQCFRRIGYSFRYDEERTALIKCPDNCQNIPLISVSWCLVACLGLAIVMGKTNFPEIRKKGTVSGESSGLENELLGNSADLSIMLVKNSNCLRKLRKHLLGGPLSFSGARISVFHDLFVSRCLTKRESLL